jgi:OOP family OmpA-OmpF porin
VILTLIHLFYLNQVYFCTVKYITKILGMKKFFLMAAMVMAGITASAQNEPLANSKLSDNWYLGGNIGAVTPLNGAFFGNMRPTVGLEVGRYLTPVFGIGVEGRAKFNTIKAFTAVDQAYGFLLGKFNLSNLFYGYKGEPRNFEVVALAGPGIEHNFGDAKDTYLAYKAGLEFNFNLGEAKAWQFNIKPGIVWGVNNALVPETELNKNGATFEINAGFTYKFKCSNGTHNFAFAKVDQSELDALNNTINRLRDENAERAKNDAATIENLKNQLKDCQNSKPATVVEKKSPVENIVTFRQGKSIIDKSQMPNIDRVAKFLNDNSSSKVVIKGYASPEGSAKLNQKLSLARANAVKKVLVNKYKIAADRIETEGLGVGSIFTEPTYNRVSICTVND